MKIRVTIFSNQQNVICTISVTHVSIGENGAYPPTKSGSIHPLLS